MGKLYFLYSNYPVSFFKTIDFKPVFVPVRLQWIDGKTKVVVRSIRESVIDLEPSEDGDELCLVERADDGEYELEVLGQHIGLLRPERHLI